MCVQMTSTLSSNVLGVGGGPSHAQCSHTITPSTPPRRPTSRITSSLRLYSAPPSRHAMWEAITGVVGSISLNVWSMAC